MSYTYPEAYSIELGYNIEPMDAYNLSLAKILKNKHNFQCDKNCPFGLTLVNFGKSPYTKEPHFRTSNFDQVHSVNCPVVQNRYEKRAQETTIEESYTFERDKNAVKVDINLVTATFTEITNSLRTEEQVSTEIRSKKSTTSNHIAKKTFNSHVKSLSRLVQLYKEFKSGEKYTFLDSSGNKLNLDLYFQNLDNNSLINEHETKVYYSKATVRYIKAAQEKDSYFLIRIKQKCQIDNLRISPTFIINESLANQQGVKQRLETLKKAAKKSKELTIYYLGPFKKYKNSYINASVPHEKILRHIVLSSS